MADRNVGNVSVRFSVQDAEVVRKALEALGRDGEAALKRIDAAGRAPSTGLRAVNEIVGDLKGRVMGLALPLGGAGQALIALGPGGLAAAAGIGLVLEALKKASEAAHAYVERQKELLNTAEQAGLAAAAVKSLEEAGARLGITNEQTTTGLVRFNVQLEALRRGEGEAVAALRRINPELLAQLQTARSTADALLILSKAYEGLDASQRNALSRTLFGRGTADWARLLDQVRRNSALVTVQDDPNAKAATEHLVAIKNEIDEIQRRTGKVWGAMFAPEVLEAEKTMAEFFERLAKTAADFKLSGDLNRLLGLAALISAGPGGLTAGAGSIVGKIIGDLFNVSGDPQKKAADLKAAIERLTPAIDDFSTGANNMRSAVELLRQQLAAAEAEIKKGQSSLVYRSPAADQALRDRLSDVGFVVPKPDQALRDTPAIGDKSPQAILSDARAVAALIGAAMSPAEQYAQRVKEINAAVAENRDLEQYRGRAIAAAALVQQQATLSLREQLGVAKEDEIVKAKLTQAYDLLAKAGVKSAEDRATAEKIVRKEAQLTAEAIRVRASDTPALTKLAIDADKLALNLDTNLASALRGNTSDMIAMAKGTERVGEGLTNMSVKLLEAVAQAQLMKSVVGPLSSLLSGFVPGAASLLGGGATAGVQARSALGNVFDRSGLMRFANGGIVTRPTLFPFANGTGLMGEAGAEAILPLRRGPGGRLGVDAGSTPFEVNLIEAPSRPNISPAKNGRGVNLDWRGVQDMMAAAIADRSSSVHGAMRDTFGLDSTRGL